MTRPSTDLNDLALVRVFRTHNGLHKWRAHGLKFAVEARDGVLGVVAPDPDAAAAWLRSLGLIVVELSLPFAELALRGCWARVWRRKLAGEIPRVTDSTWLLLGGATLPVDEQGNVVLAGEGN